MPSSLPAGARRTTVTVYRGESLEEVRSAPQGRQTARTRRREPGGVRAGESSAGQRVHCDAANRRSCVAIAEPAARSHRSAPLGLRSGPKPAPQGPPTTNRRSARCVSPSCSRQTRSAIRDVFGVMQPSGRTNVGRCDKTQTVERRRVRAAKLGYHSGPCVAVWQHRPCRSVAFPQPRAIRQRRPAGGCSEWRGGDYLQ